MPTRTNPPGYRPELPLIPARMLDLPVRRQYPVPWFVGINPDTNDYDFRIADHRKIVRAHREGRCWVCGEKRGRYYAFVIGPMCAINRVSSEPPSHLDCADFSARACPFLVRPYEDRREGGMPQEDMVVPPGVGLLRNPGVALVWVTDSYELVPVRTRAPIEAAAGATSGVGALFHIGNPIEVRWYCEGREAKRAEVMHSIETGLPSLLAAAAHDGAEDLKQLEQQKIEALALLPAV